jgi:hypothetical protein
MARLAIVGALVACAWVGMHVLFTYVYPDDSAAGTAYRYRDDALVTLSHARGLADVGTVSVSVSGSRVEGYSAPLQFAAASGYYGLGGKGYRGFLDAQVVVTTMLLGVSVFALLRMAVPRRRPVTTALVTLLVAAALFGTYDFFAWHSSGMENSITNALTAAVVAALAFAIRRRSFLPVAGIVVALFALTRVEFAFHAVPLLVVAGAFLAVGAPAGERWRRVALLVAPAVGLWLAVLAIRLWYFRDLFPNTAEAQDISPASNVRLWAEVLWPLLLPAAYAAFRALRRREIDLRGLVRSPAFSVAAAAGAAGAALLAWRAYANDDLPGFDVVAVSSRALGLWWWVALVVGLALLVRPRLGPVEALLVTLVASGGCHLLVFGPARLAPERVVTFLLVPLGCLAAAFALRLQPPRVLVASAGSTTSAGVGAPLLPRSSSVPSSGDWSRIARGRPARSCAATCRRSRDRCSRRCRRSSADPVCPSCRSPTRTWASSLSRSGSTSPTSASSVTRCLRGSGAGDRNQDAPTSPSTTSTTTRRPTSSSSTANGAAGTRRGGNRRSSALSTRRSVTTAGPRPGAGRNARRSAPWKAASGCVPASRTRTIRRLP